MRVSPKRSSPRSSLRRASPRSSPGSSAAEASSPVGDVFVQQVTRITALLEDDMKQSRLETIKMKAAVRRAQKAQAEAEAAKAHLRESLEQFNAVKSEITKCGVCMDTMNRPFVLVECGHSYCYGCLRLHFHTCLRNQVKWRDVPEHLREPSTADQLHELIENEHIYSPLYYCPSCKGTVRCRPIEVYIFKELIEAVHSVAGPPDDLTVEDPHINDSDIWADMFYTKRA
ncbi:hypothetical protein BKA82DRAFT_19240 [Pisolithus tinctorius]|uniref:RING-type domain-containing protein n=1 Tax=Pisolithus tinctorius Marx 270 TaxID=870435 RepID=A0A0C3PTA2_PISTI|nr:hypothetical protein BKA82DRAFT_19240 [Pisolithus tinctorius]KIO12416.1 hypothetical protein M404DRAFT_19240 [Pisolithus tinctorius Marx 270]